MAISDGLTEELLKKLFANLTHHHVNLIDSQYPSQYWTPLFDKIEVLMFAENDFQSLRKIYRTIYPLSPLSLLEQSDNTLQIFFLERWMPGIIDLFQNIIELLEEFDFTPDYQQNYSCFHDLVYEFYSDRIKWCQEISSSYDGPENREVIGFPGMILTEYSDPYYFPWDDEFQNTEEVVPFIEKFLIVLMLPLEEILVILQMITQNHLIPLANAFVAEVDAAQFKIPFTVFDDMEVSKYFPIKNPLKIREQLEQLSPSQKNSNEKPPKSRTNTNKTEEIDTKTPLTKKTSKKKPKPTSD